MNQPTEDRIKNLEERQEDFDKRLAEVEGRQTEPIPATTRIEIASADVLNQLKALEQGQQELKQEFHTVYNTLYDTLQEHYDEHKEAISDVKTVQSGHSKFFEEHGKRLAATATKDDISKIEARQERQESLLQEILNRLPPKS